ncbi:MAG: DMT family transporter [Thermoanaerobaculia bacterium]|nr:DMT family transporter [Thermoanaerobaculia bacterium]
MSPLVQVFYLTLGLIPVLAAWAATSGGGEVSWLYALVAGASIVLNVLANLAYVKALEVSDLSLSVPLLSLTPAVAATFAVFLLGEHLSTRQTGGVLLVVVGALLLTTSHATTRSFSGWVASVSQDRGSLYMLLVAISWSLTLPLDKMAVLQVGPPRHALISIVGVAAGTLGILLLKGQGRRLFEVQRRIWPLVLAAVLVSGFAFGLQLVLLETVEVGVIDGTKRALGNFMALLFGATIYRESVTLIKVAALSVMAGGVLLILT